MNASPTILPGVLLVTSRVFRDARGAFMEIWRESGHAEAGISGPFVQDNVSRSVRHVLRGLHFQQPDPQGKLVTPVAGTIYDVAVDVRRDSPTFGQWCGEELDSEAGTQLYVPAGFAHGFLVLSESATVMYKCTTYYNPAAEWTLLWNDPAVGIEWPVAAPILSEKDAAGRLLGALPPQSLPIAQ